MRKFKILVFILALTIVLIGCEGNNDTSGDDTTEYRFLVEHEQGLYAVNPQNPDDAIDVDPELNARSNAMQFVVLGSY